MTAREELNYLAALQIARMTDDEVERAVKIARAFSALEKNPFGSEAGLADKVRIQCVGPDGVVKEEHET